MRKGTAMFKWFKRHAGLVYIAVMSAVMAVILLCTDEWGNVAEAVRAMQPGWAVMAGGCVAVYLFLRMATMRYYLRRRNYAFTWRDAAAVTGTGQFYSAITPSASGGQPMQVWELHRRGIPVGVGTACVSVKFIGFQTAVLLTGGILWLSNRGMVARELSGFRWLIALGFAVNAGLLAIIAMTVSHADMLMALIRRMVVLGERMHVVRKPQELQGKLCSAVGEYRAALGSLLRAPADAAVVLIMSVLQVLAYMFIVICIHKSFGMEETDCAALLTLQYLLFIAAAFVPLPGAAGAQEGGFCLFFRNMFYGEYLTAAMVCWRFFSYYLLMFSGLATMAVGRTEKQHGITDQ